jgi:fumarylacetoacetase
VHVRPPSFKLPFGAAGFLPERFNNSGVTELNATHDPKRRSWLESANDPATDFPIQNLPFGIYEDIEGVARGGVAIGDQIVDIARARDKNLFSGAAARAADAATGPVLNPLLRLGKGPASRLRAALGNLLDAEQRDSELRLALGGCLVPMRLVKMRLPVEIGAFTDFLCSIDHTLRMGRNALPKAFKHLPIAYNGRATSVVVSGTPVTRPNGQFARGELVAYGPEPALDFELEIGAFVAGGNALGQPFPLADAGDQLFGTCLLNDWSARGMQMFESAPLGPFLGKSFATSISPWIVTSEALLPYRVAMPEREGGDPEPPHLTSAANTGAGALDLTLQAFVLTPKMRAAGLEPARITTTAFRDMYWSLAQMLAHHASNGCNLRTGDLIGSGTTSGAADESRACLAEITARGTEPLRLPNGELRAWLEDGDEVILRGHTANAAFARIGFGECRGRITAAPGTAK